MAIVTATKSEYKPLPTGEYLAQVTDIESEEGNYGPQFKLIFEITSPKEHAGRIKMGWASQKISMGSKPSKLAGWASSIFNRPIVEGENVDTDDFVGRKVVLVIVSTVDDKGEEVDRLTALKPYKKQEPFKQSDSGSFNVGPEESDDEDPFESE